MLELTDLDTNTILYLTKYSKLNNNKIYVKPIKSTTEVEHKYRLRMWIDENVLISDTSDDKTYCASSRCNDSTKKIYTDLFASIKVHVYGDLEVKHLYEYNVMGTLDSFSSYKESIKEVYFLNEEQYLIEESYNAATIKFDITNTSKTVGTTELRNMDVYGRVLAWLEPNGSYYKLYIASDGYTYLSTGKELFDGYTTLTTIDLNNVRTFFVTNMYNMFEYSTTLKNIIGLSNFNTSNVTNMAFMFDWCQCLTSLDLSNFDTSKVTDMSCMFSGCPKITSLDLSGFNTSKVTNMWGMFANCYKLTSLDVSGFDTSNVKNFATMFYKCSSLTTLDLSSFSTKKVTTMKTMFADSTLLNKIYVSNKWALSGTYYNCNNMFTNCTNLVGGAGTTYNSSHVDYPYARIDTAVYDTDGTLLSGNPGYFTLKSV